ncbi:MAG TPA: RnfABCDGE type electron transport complex subunit D [candidate division WOR-3 bacterium]|uniref:Ion-translocating oxidoreductase complex subunit D n=1 Tax=candidate division WOR-3 bacterium TaxID=2052148 RepID=A0A7V0T7X8_UNCW3|nr:RnfABCDGE type electron transport complex subunit D [candidate division WOR-3 bacterium]
MTQLTVTASPHLRAPGSVRLIMWLVVASLVPAFAGSVWFFGWRALMLTGLGVVSAVGFDALAQKLFGRKVTVDDGSAVITGLLLALNLPPAVPWWIPVVGSAFAVVIVKQFFGGLGHNFVNPALAARAFLVVSWPGLMTAGWLAPRGGNLSGIDGITGATPLAVLKNASEIAGPGGDPAGLLAQAQSWPVVGRLFFGSVGGCLGETSALLLLAGGVFLLVTRLIDWRIPAGYIGTVLVLALVLPGPKHDLLPYLGHHVFGGGLMLGAFFMATDYVTSPITSRGRWVFAVGCGILTVLIRLWGGYPEGVSYSILLMNVATPLIDRFTRPRLFGRVKKATG